MSRLALLAAGVALCTSPVLAKPVALTDAQLDAITAGADFSQSNLVADQAGVAANTDPNLVNPWGVAQSPTGPLWVADNGTGVSTLYDSAGVPQSLVVTIPSPGGSSATGTPTGAVFNSGNDFTVSAGGKSGAATFLFATEDGTIVGWNSQVNPTNAVTAVDNSTQGSVFKGLTIAQVGNSNHLYVADFGKGQVEMFDSQFHPLGSFTDPSLPAGFAPFDVQAINGALYVTFAKQQANHHDDAAGPGNGFVDVFDTSGHLIHQLAAHGTLNSPWGMTLAPAGFGQFGGALLVGNFGDGKINAFDPVSGAFLGQVTKPGGQPLAIDGLWSLHPGQGTSGTVVFTAGPNGEQNGLLGTLQPSTTVTASQGGTATALAATNSAAQQAATAISKVANAALAGAGNAMHH